MFGILAFVVSMGTAYAQWEGGGGTTESPLIDDEGDIVRIITDISTWIYRVFFIIAVLYILLAAYMYLTAKDDAAQVKKAQTSLKNAVIAIIIALISTGASLLIQSFLK